MADNYLGRKMEEYFARPAQEKSKAKIGGLARLLLKNRSYRAYDEEFKVRDDQIQRILEVNTRIPSAMNRQPLRFRVVKEDEAEKVLNNIHLGSALPHLKLPPQGQQPKTFIVICSSIPEDRYVDIDLGIAAQSMLLQATEIGLNGICIAAFSPEVIARELSLSQDMKPVLILALGKGAEKIRLAEISADESHSYYRENGGHVVPKVRLEELILPK